MRDINRGRPMVLYEIREPKDRPSINTEEGWNALAERMNRGHEDRVSAEPGGGVGAGCADSEEPLGSSDSADNRTPGGGCAGTDTGSAEASLLGN